MRKSASPAYEKTKTWNTNLTIGDKLEGVYQRREKFNGDYGETVKEAQNNDERRVTESEVEK